MYQVQTEDLSTQKCWFLAVSKCNSTLEVTINAFILVPRESDWLAIDNGTSAPAYKNQNWSAATSFQGPRFNKSLTSGGDEDVTYLSAFLCMVKISSINLKKKNTKLS